VNGNPIIQDRTLVGTAIHVLVNDQPEIAEFPLRILLNTVRQKKLRRAFHQKTLRSFFAFMIPSLS